MKKINLILSSLCLLSLNACAENGNSSKISISSIVSSSSINEETYQFELTIKSIGGDRLNDVTINIFKDTKLIETVVTNYIGNAKVDLPEGDYTATLENLPKGMFGEDSYAFNGQGGKFTFTCLSSVIEEEVPEGTTYDQGDLVYDFAAEVVKTSEDTETTSYTLSDLLKEKKYVVLNFWASWCGPCVAEFSEFNQAYKIFKDDIEILALNIEPNDTLEDIKDFMADYDITFPMGKDIAGLYSIYDFGGYIPGTAIINEYGVIEFKKTGGFSTDELTDMLDEFING